MLKRAHELIGVNQAPAALNLLHEHVTSKRSRNVPIASLEPVMLLLVELSVEQKKGKLAKDALYQYKNISQNTNIGTIEVRCIPLRLPERRGKGREKRKAVKPEHQFSNTSTACLEEIHRVGR